MRYELKVAFRNLGSARRTFVSTISMVSMVGVVLGVTALTATVSVSGGFQKAYRERVLGVFPHIIVEGRGRFDEYPQVIEAIEQIEGVRAVGPYLQQSLMIYSDGGRAMVLTQGVEVDRLGDMTDLNTYLLDGSLDDLVYDPFDADAGPPGLFVGVEMARRLDVDVGDEVTLVSHLRGLGTSLGPSNMAPTSGQFWIAGIFEVGYHDFDSLLALTDLQAMRDFINVGPIVTALDVRVDDVFDTDRISSEITARLTAGVYTARTWQVQHRNLFESLRIQKFWLSIIMTGIVVVACFNIISTLVLMVLDKTKEIAILKSMGATRHGIMRIFMAQGLAIGVVGTLLGLLGGFIICVIIDAINFGLDPTVYKVSEVAVDMRPEEFLLIGGVSIVIAFLSTLYPAWQASKQEPVDGLRYD